MIALARADVRRFRAAARRGYPNGRPKGPAPPVQITADGGTTTLAAHLGEVVVALRAYAPTPGRGNVVLSLDALAEFEGGSGTITLGLTGRSAVTAKWDDGPAPRSATIEPVGADLAWPAESDHLVAFPPTFPRALHEAGRSAAREPGKYAVTRVQVRGKAGEVVGTDGKQALVQGGFVFPFAEDLLVPAVPVFGLKDLAGESAVSVGLADGWLEVVVGPWRVWLLVDREGRFPDVHAAIPRACRTRVELADTDAETLLAALPDLPAADGPAGPVTLDLGPMAIVRARADPAAPVAEVALPGSTVTGPPVRVVLSRDHLGRILALGFRELQVNSPERPVVARAGDRVFLAATHDPGCAIPPDDSPPTRLRERSPTMPARDTPSPDRNGHADPPPVGDQIDLLTEAEGLRASLTDAVNRATRLVAALKHFRKERRALASAWSSLRQLNLGP